MERQARSVPCSLQLGEPHHKWALQPGKLSVDDKPTLAGIFSKRGGNLGFDITQRGTNRCQSLCNITTSLNVKDSNSGSSSSFVSENMPIVLTVLRIWNHGLHSPGVGRPSTISSDFGTRKLAITRQLLEQPQTTSASPNPKRNRSTAIWKTTMLPWSPKGTQGLWVAVGRLVNRPYPAHHRLFNMQVHHPSTPWTLALIFGTIATPPSHTIRHPRPLHIRSYCQLGQAIGRRIGQCWKGRDVQQSPISFSRIFPGPGTATRDSTC